MSLNDTMTNLMNAVRTVLGSQNKISITDATRELNGFAKTSNYLIAMPTLSSGNTVSTPEGNSQTITVDGTNGYFEIGIKNDKYFSASKGSRVRQSVLLRSSYELNTFTISFFTVSSSGVSAHHIVPMTISKLGDKFYKLSADYTVTEDARIRLLDFYNDSAHAFIPKEKITFTFSQPFVGVVSQVGG
ncbi:hypothetical protein [Limosilactobacillus sp.]|uniref:hypothetical protein n=1 Tax=Limosilactobacillus sp. TaxID=2773925 RepID=UPI003F0F80DC